MINLDTRLSPASSDCGRSFGASFWYLILLVEKSCLRPVSQLTRTIQSERTSTCTCFSDPYTEAGEASRTRCSSLSQSYFQTILTVILDGQVIQVKTARTYETRASVQAIQGQSATRWHKKPLWITVYQKSSKSWSSKSQRPASRICFAASPP